MSYNAPQALEKRSVLLAMQKKYNEARRELRMYEEGMEKLQGIEDRAFYELTYKLSDSSYTMFVQCWKIRRDSIWFRIFASSLPENFKTSLVYDHETISLSWHWDWQVKPAKIDDAPLYVGFDWKTSHFDKIMKGKYHGCKLGYARSLLH